MEFKAVRMFTKNEDIRFSHQVYTEGFHVRDLPTLPNNERKRDMTEKERNNYDQLWKNSLELQPAQIRFKSLLPSLHFNETEISLMYQ